jgi:hypothetical protein
MLQTKEQGVESYNPHTYIQMVDILEDIPEVTLAHNFNSLKKSRMENNLRKLTDLEEKNSQLKISNEQLQI